MEIIEMQAHEANQKADGNRVMARLYLYCLKNNLNPINGTMCNNNDIKRTTITFGINKANHNILDKLIIDSYDSHLLDLIKIQVIKNKVCLTIGAIENDNGNMLNGFLLRKLFSYKNQKIESNGLLNTIYYKNKNEEINYDLTVIESDKDAYEVYKTINNVSVEENIAFGLDELDNLIHKFDLKIRRK